MTRTHRTPRPSAPTRSRRSRLADRTDRAALRSALACLLAVGLTSLVLSACGGDPNEDRKVVRPDISQLPADQVEQPKQSGELSYQLPAGWQEEQPSSGMRLAQASVPGEAGPAELAIFYFGPDQGGGVEANISRWIGQVQMEEGTEPLRDSFEQGDLTIHTVEARGTVTGSPMSMAGGQPDPTAGSMLVGAVVEGPGGPWFLKMTGPAETVEAAKDDFYAMLRGASVRPSA